MYICQGRWIQAPWARAAGDLICIQTVATFQFPRADYSLKTSIVRTASGIFVIIVNFFQSEWLMKDSWIVGVQYEKKEILHQEQVWEGQMWWWPLTWWVGWGRVRGGIGNCDLGVRYKGGNISHRLVLWDLEICHLLTLCGCQSKSRLPLPAPAWVVKVPPSWLIIVSKLIVSCFLLLT